MATAIENPVQQAMAAPARQPVSPAMVQAPAAQMLRQPTPLEQRQRAAFQQQAQQAGSMQQAAAAGMAPMGGGYGQPGVQRQYVGPQGYGQPQQQQQFSPEMMQQFFQAMQQYQQRQQMPGAGAYQPQTPQYGYQQRMAAQQQNPMQGAAPASPYQAATAPTMAAPTPAAQAPRPMAAYAPQMTAAQVRAPLGTASAAPMAQAPNFAANPVQRALGPQQTGLAMSDATQKVLSQPSLADDFLNHMKPYSYKYKDPAMEPRIAPTGGTYLGVMAQDLEKVPHIGPQLVVDTPHGKMVDQKTALSATMAGLARINERLSAVEADLTKKRGK